MSLTEYERETIISFSDGDGVAQVYTAQRRMITKLRNNPAAELVEEGTHDGSAWARFRIAAELVSFRSVRVRLELTEEQRRERAERLRRPKGQETAESA